ncbi:hypothetical protein T492DRAFT_1146506 [Pavlovales sp. CCMP2436]|nr:hypothetical protein T492DRAFT_1146506 [Pavlovales sp. CCMP2436]
MGADGKAKGRAKKVPGELTAEQRRNRLNTVLAVSCVSLMFCLMLGGAVALKKAKLAGRLKLDGGAAGSDGVDRALAVGLGGLALALFGVTVARHLLWLQTKTRELWARAQEVRARDAATRAEAIAAREQRRQQKASRERGGADGGPSYGFAEDDLLDELRNATASAWEWLRRSRWPLAPGAHAQSNAPVRPSKGAAAGKGHASRVRGAPSAPKASGQLGGANPGHSIRWSARRAEAAAASDGEEEDFSQFEEALLHGVAAAGAGVDGEEESGEAEEEEAEVEAEATELVRVPLFLSAAEEGTRIELRGLSCSSTLASVQVAQLVLALRCTCCKSDFTLTASLSALDARAQQHKFWCEKCAALFSASLRPSLLAPGGSGAVLAYVDTVDCAVVDVLPASELLAVCLACEGEALLSPLQRNRRAEAVCRGCFAKLTLCASEIRLARLTAGSSVARAAGRSGGAKTFDAELKAFAVDAAKAHGVASFTTGEPLPNEGACDHFKKSHRWLRFPCCGLALPCPACHEKSGCPAAELGVTTNGMICGLCSREQPFGAKCECGAVFLHTFTAHWQGGTGCRDQLRLSKKDAHKHHGAHKTSSNKMARVGAAGARAAGARAAATARA